MLRICILSANEQGFTVKRLVEEAKNRGHDVKVVNFLRCYLNVSHKHPSISYDGMKLNDQVDVIIPRIGVSDTFFGAAVVRQFEMLKKYCLNGSLGITRSKDKLRSLQILVRKGLPVPVTSFTHSTMDTKGLVEMVGGVPVIVKLIEGMQGIGVVLAETQKTADSVLDAFGGLKANMVVQEFIREAEGEDIRCFVIGDRVVASMRRKAKDGEFRANLHRGGSAESIAITEQERQMAISAVRELKLNVGGVDIIRSHAGPLILEVNSTPGVEGIEKATKVNVAEEIIKFAEEHYPQGLRNIDDVNI